MRVKKRQKKEWVFYTETLKTVFLPNGRPEGLTNGNELEILHAKAVGNNQQVTDKTNGRNFGTKNTSFVGVGHDQTTIFDNQSGFGVAVNFFHFIFLSYSYLLKLKSL